MADFSSVAPGWSASFDSAPAIAWGVIFQEYIAEFGPGGFFDIAAPGGMQFLGMLTSGLALSFPDGTAETVGWFQGRWNNGYYADGVMVWDDFETGAPVTLTVTTYTPEPGSFLLLGSALAALAGKLRRTLRSSKDRPNKKLHLGLFRRPKPTGHAHNPHVCQVFVGLRIACWNPKQLLIQTAA